MWRSIVIFCISSLLYSCSGNENHLLNDCMHTIENASSHVDGEQEKYFTEFMQNIANHSLDEKRKKLSGIVALFQNINQEWKANKRIVNEDLDSLTDLIRNDSLRYRYEYKEEMESLNVMTQMIKKIKNGDSNMPLKNNEYVLLKLTLTDWMAQHAEMNCCCWYNSFEIKYIPDEEIIQQGNKFKAKVILSRSECCNYNNLKDIIAPKDGGFYEKDRNTYIVYTVAKRKTKTSLPEPAVLNFKLKVRATRTLSDSIIEIKQDYIISSCK